MLDRRSLVSWVTALAFTTLVSGCSARIGDFTLMSTKNIGQLSRKGQSVKAEDCACFLFMFIPVCGGNMQPNAKTAVDRALEGTDGDLLIDGVFYSNFFFIPYIWLQSCFRVEGYGAQGEFAKK